MQIPISLVPCPEYQPEWVLAAIQESLANLGGLEKYIQKGERILLKVNLIMKKKPEEAATTHPTLVWALAKILLDYGAQVLIGDSPGGPFSTNSLRRIYRVCGMEQIAADTNAQLNYNTNQYERANPQGLFLKTITAVDMLNEVDLVVNVAKLKTHGMMTYTGAVKNMFGLIPGVLKAEYHLNMPERGLFADALLDICLCANPTLSFIDAIVGMEGAGPTSGTPRKIGVILASPSPYALDKVGAQIINLDFAAIPTIQRAIERKLCAPGFEDIEFIGSPLEDFIVPDFQIPDHLRSVLNKTLPRPVKSISNTFIQPRPIFQQDLCIGCGDCVENCPAKVLELVDQRPQIDLKNCIRCFCCQELCPQKAVSIQRPWVSRILHSE